MPVDIRSKLNAVIHEAAPEFLDTIAKYIEDHPEVVAASAAPLLGAGAGAVIAPEGSKVKGATIGGVGGAVAGGAGLAAKEMLDKSPQSPGIPADFQQGAMSRVDSFVKEQNMTSMQRVLRSLRSLVTGGSN